MKTRLSLSTIFVLFFELLAVAGWVIGAWFVSRINEVPMGVRAGIVIFCGVAISYGVWLAIQCIRIDLRRNQIHESRIDR